MTIRVRFPATNLERARATFERVQELFGLLWGAGRLRPLLASPEGVATLETYEAIMKSVRPQLAGARDDGATFNVDIPYED